MPISEAIARRELRRFGSYVPLPGKEDLARIVRAFTALAHSEAQAQRIADQLEKSLHFYPKISDLHEAAEALSEANQCQLPEFTGLRSARCHACQDTGFLIRQKGEHSFAYPCNCRPKPEEALAGKGAVR